MERIERNIFNGLLKDVISHLYDLAAVEIHPLSALITPPAGFHGSHGEYLQQVIWAAIEKLPPSGRTFSPLSPEWRPYLILHKRYIEGLSPQAVASDLALSERQLRRDHSRALQALAGRLWDQLFPAVTSANAEESESTAPAFAIQPEVLDLGSVVAGAVETLQRRAQAENVRLEYLPGKAAAPVLADRVVLRQVLFSLLNYAFHIQVGGEIRLNVRRMYRQARAEIEVNTDEHWVSWDDDEHEDSLESAKHWAAQIGAAIQENYPQQGQPGRVRLVLSLHPAGHATILVVEDQTPTLRMYQRYLSRSTLKVIGISDPHEALPMARQLQPALIMLDVMMPSVDGWEILQSLQMDEETKQIPVIVCSAWDAPEMAHSLGAADFLKKPITQQALLDVLSRLHLPVSDKPAEAR